VGRHGRRRAARLRRLALPQGLQRAPQPEASTRWDEQRMQSAPLLVEGEGVAPRDGLVA
jgi:hypothetical protein